MLLEISLWALFSYYRKKTLWLLSISDRVQIGTKKKELTKNFLLKILVYE